MPKIKVTQPAYQKPIFTPNFSSFGLQMAKKIQNIHFFGGPNHFCDWYPKKVFFFSHLKAKCAEIWCEHRFLIDGLGDFDFGHFRPFLAELWQKTKFENGKICPFLFLNWSGGT